MPCLGCYFIHRLLHIYYQVLCDSFGRCPLFCFGMRGGEGGGGGGVFVWKLYFFFLYVFIIWIRGIPADEKAYVKRRVINICEYTCRYISYSSVIVANVEVSAFFNASCFWSYLPLTSLCTTWFQWRVHLTNATSDYGRTNQLLDQQGQFHRPASLHASHAFPALRVSGLN